MSPENLDLSSRSSLVGGSLDLARDSAPREMQVSRVPSGILEMRKPPEQVYLWGELPPEPWVSIVGTRRPTPEGREAAFSLAQQLSSCGITVVSGGALGIDSAAHEGALAAGGRTLVVAPTWLDRAYPVENRGLFAKVIEKGGGYLSISKPQTPALTPAFFRRNEVMMAMSLVAVLGECPYRSGARNALLHARNMGRKRFVLPFPFDQNASAGSSFEIVHEGAEVLPRASPLLEFLKGCGVFANPAWWQWCQENSAGGVAKGSVPADSPQEGRLQAVMAEPKEKEARDVLETLRRGAQTVDEICEASGLFPSEAQHQILLLTLSGHVFEDDKGLLRYHPTHHERR